MNGKIDREIEKWLKSIDIKESINIKIKRIKEDIIKRINRDQREIENLFCKDNPTPAIMNEYIFQEKDIIDFIFDSKYFCIETKKRNRGRKCGLMQ